MSDSAGRWGVVCNLVASRYGRIVAALVFSVSTAAFAAGQTSAGAIAMDNDDIAGIVTGPDGPEGGVWVIAETSDLPTRHIKIVVTDDDGRYLLPDLPTATYDVWVRGYGLVDSEGSGGARYGTRSDRGSGARRKHRRRVLPGPGLVRLARASSPQRVSGHGRCR